MKRSVVGFAMLTAVLLGCLPAVALEAPAFLLPNAHGVVDYGDRVLYELSGSCHQTLVRAIAVVGDEVVRSAPDAGCRGTVTIPSLDAVLATGYVEGDPATVYLEAGSVTLPLVLQRSEPQQWTAAAGAPTVVPAEGDPFGGVSAMSMSTGDTVDLGQVDLTNIESVTVRHSAAGGAGQWELRVGSADGRAIANGQLGYAIGSAGTGDWWNSVSQLAWRIAAPVVGDENLFGNLTPAVGEDPHVYLAIVAASGPVLVNWVDYNGNGASELYRFTNEAPWHWDVLFDGSSFDGWQHTGPGRFELHDGAMRATHEPYEIGWAWLWYSRAQYSDFVLRLRFKVEKYEDNGGILLRHGDPRDDPNKVTGEADEMQIQDGFENNTGGIAHLLDASRLATNIVGEWNQVEIVAVGDLYVIRINGREVARHTTTMTRRSGFISVENEQLIPASGGHLWYDDIRVHRCNGASDPLCATS